MLTRKTTYGWLLAGIAAVAYAGSPATLRAQVLDDIGDQVKDAVESVEDAADDAVDNDDDKAPSHSGEFAGMGDGEFRMTVDGKKAHTHKVNASTKVTIDGKRAALEDLQKGDRITVTTGANNVALTVAAKREQPARKSEPGQPTKRSVTLGVRLGPSPTTGVLIRDLHPQGPGAAAGLRSGDYILSINDQKIESVEAFDETLSQLQPGDRAELVIWRNRQKQPLTVTFSEERMAAFRPADDNQGGDGWLGVLLEESDNANGNAQGVRIARVYPSGPAARAGLRSGDMLLQVSGKKVTSPDETAEIISAAKPSEQIELIVNRDGEDETMTVMLADRRAFFRQDDSGQGNGEFREFDDDEVSEHAMMLEQHRRFAEQHERIEKKLDQVLDELDELRRQLGQKPAARGAEATP